MSGNTFGTFKPLISLNSIDLFCGAGGLSIGLEQSGFQTVLAVEINRDACATYRLHNPHTDLRSRPIQEVDFHPFQGIDLIAGGPPCQPFSSGGLRRASEDERDMIPEFIRAVREARPRAFLMENVPGLISGCRREYFRLAIQSFEALGYSVSWKVLNAADYGVPQKRKRLFVIGMIGQTFAFPPATHGQWASCPHVPISKCLQLGTVTGEANASKITYAKNPDLRPNPYDGHLFNGGGRPLDPNAPSHTILASAGGNKTHFLDTLGLVPQYHAHLLKGGEPCPSATLKGARRLTVMESAIIQTFPPGIDFCGSRSSQYHQIGNAVPPMLAKAVGGAILDALQSTVGSCTNPMSLSVAT